MNPNVVWGVRHQLADLTRYVDMPLHVMMIEEAREAIDAWLALLVDEELVAEPVMSAARDLVVARLLGLAYLVDFPEGREVAASVTTLMQTGAVSRRTGPI